MDLPAPEMTNEKPLIDLSNTPDLIRTASVKSPEEVGVAESQLVLCNILTAVLPRSLVCLWPRHDVTDDRSVFSIAHKTVILISYSHLQSVR